MCRIPAACLFGLLVVLIIGPGIVSPASLPLFSGEWEDLPTRPSIRTTRRSAYTYYPSSGETTEASLGEATLTTEASPGETTEAQDDDDVMGVLSALVGSPSLALARSNETNSFNFVAVGQDIDDGNYIVEVHGGVLALRRIPRPEVETPEEPSPTESQYHLMETLDNKTNGFIRKSEEAANEYVMSLLQYKTQLNLNTLNGLLPTLEEIAKNMTQLQNSSIEDPMIYKEEAQILEQELVDTETKLVRSRVVAQKTASVPSSIITPLRNIHETLIKTLKSQMAVLSLGELPDDLEELRTPATVVAEPDDHQTIIQGLKTFLNSTFQNPMNEAAADAIMRRMQGLTNGTRKEGFYYLFETISSNRTWPDTLTVRALAALRSQPEITRRLISLLPDVAQNVFQKRGHCIESRPHYLHWTVSNTSSAHQTLRVSRGRSCTDSNWKFEPVENGKYFLIVHETQNAILGVNGLGVSVNLKSQSDLSNPSFHWTLAISDTTTLQFISRQNNKVLGLNDDTAGPVYLQTPESENSNQRWLLK